MSPSNTRMFRGETWPRRKVFALLAFVLALHVLPFASRAALIGGDEPHYALMASSIAFDRDLRLSDDYDAVERGATFAGRKAAGSKLARHVRTVRGNEVFSHPIGLPLLAAPLVLVNRLLGGTSPDVPLALLTLTITFCALIVGFRLVAALTASTRDAALVVAGTYFGSPLWFYSRTFFTEPYSWSFAVFAIAAIRARRLIVASLWLALVLAMKETGAILVIAVMSAVVLQQGLRRSLPLFVGPALFGIFFGIKNYVSVGTPLSTFQRYDVGAPLSGAVGLFLDPFHGLLWFSPLLAVATIGWFVSAPWPRRFLWASFVSFAGYYLVTAAWADWRGGSCYATRLLLPALPALVLPALAVYRQSARHRLLFSLLFVVSFVPNWVAANRPFSAFWGEIGAVSLVRQNPWLAAAGVAVASGLLYAIAAAFPQRELDIPSDAGSGTRA